MKKLFLIQGVYQPEADFPRSMGVSEPSDSAPVASQAVNPIQAQAPVSIDAIVNEMGVTGMARVAAAIAYEEATEAGGDLTRVQAAYKKASKALGETAITGEVWELAKDLDPSGFDPRHRPNQQSSIRAACADARVSLGPQASFEQVWELANERRPSVFQ